MFLIFGIALLVLVLRDIFQTVVVPRGKIAGYRIAPLLVHNLVWPPFRYAASKIGSAAWRAEVLGLFAPFVLVMLLTIWICLLIAAFGLIAFALDSNFSPPLDSLLTALYVSGSSVLTLGASEFTTKSTAARFLLLAAAFVGMFVTASVVSLLFTLIGAIHRREILVSITANIAGSPASGIAVLETYSLLNGQKSLADFYDEWHHWCADISESHKAYPILPFYRSNDPLTSWLTALGAVLDSMALLFSANPDMDCFPARVTYHFGSQLVNDLANTWKLELPELQAPSDEEFHSVYLRLQAANYCSHDEKAAKENFALLRKEYLPAHRALCQYIAASHPPLSTEYRLQLPTLQRK